ncbi:unnamed protein product [Danaus chrysippus]|uniref:(African queen) hypothetical protein n=1 Tax=Danaus chrysippus TaxID=151541 RepID=A0A8J2QGD4_9NEOP|nr:unnamed protein product [Danaus chrysippus]
MVHQRVEPLCRFAFGFWPAAKSLQPLMSWEPPTSQQPTLESVKALLERPIFLLIWAGVGFRGHRCVQLLLTKARLHAPHLGKLFIQGDYLPR